MHADAPVYALPHEIGTQAGAIDRSLCTKEHGWMVKIGTRVVHCYSPGNKRYASDGCTCVFIWTQDKSHCDNWALHSTDLDYYHGSPQHAPPRGGMPPPPPPPPPPKRDPDDKGGKGDKDGKGRFTGRGLGVIKNNWRGGPKGGKFGKGGKGGKGKYGGKRAPADDNDAVDVGEPSTYCEQCEITPRLRECHPRLLENKIDTKAHVQNSDVGVENSKVGKTMMFQAAAAHMIKEHLRTRRLRVCGSATYARCGHGWVHLLGNAGTHVSDVCTQTACVASAQKWHHNASQRQCVWALCSEHGHAVLLYGTMLSTITDIFTVCTSTDCLRQCRAFEYLTAPDTTAMPHNPATTTYDVLSSFHSHRSSSPTELATLGNNLLHPRLGQTDGPRLVVVIGGGRNDRTDGYPATSALDGAVVINVDHANDSRLDYDAQWVQVAIHAICRSERVNSYGLELCCGPWSYLRMSGFGQAFATPLFSSKHPNGIPAMLAIPAMKEKIGRILTTLAAYLDSAILVDANGGLVRTETAASLATRSKSAAAHSTMLDTDVYCRFRERVRAQQRVLDQCTKNNKAQKPTSIVLNGEHSHHLDEYNDQRCKGGHTHAAVQHTRGGPRHAEQFGAYPHPLVMDFVRWDRAAYASMLPAAAATVVHATPPAADALPRVPAPSLTIEVSTLTIIKLAPDDTAVVIVLPFDFSATPLIFCDISGHFIGGRVPSDTTPNEVAGKLAANLGGHEPILLHRRTAPTTLHVFGLPASADQSYANIGQALLVWAPLSTVADDTGCIALAASRVDRIGGSLTPSGAIVGMSTEPRPLVPNPRQRSWAELTGANPETLFRDCLLHEARIRPLLIDAIRKSRVLEPARKQLLIDNLVMMKDVLHELPKPTQGLPSYRDASIISMEPPHIPRPPVDAGPEMLHSVPPQRLPPVRMPTHWATERSDEVGVVPPWVARLMLKHDDASCKLKLSTVKHGSDYESDGPSDLLIGGGAACRLQLLESTGTISSFCAIWEIFIEHPATGIGPINIRIGLFDWTQVDFRRVIQHLTALIGRSEVVTFLADGCRFKADAPHTIRYALRRSRSPQLPTRHVTRRPCGKAVPCGEPNTKLRNPRATSSDCRAVEPSPATHNKH